MATFRATAAEDLAARMLVRGARNKLVECHTHLSSYAIREIRNRECGDSPAKSGPVPSMAIRTSRIIQMHRSIVAVVYRRIGQGDIYDEINIENVIIAYDIYCALAEPPAMVSFDDAWMIARDLRAKSIEIARCPTCSVDYLSGSSARIITGCPYCAR